MRAEANPPPGAEAPEAILLDAFGTLVELEPPGPRLRSALRALAGVEVSEEAASAAFRAEIAFYLDHHLEGRDATSLEHLRDDCADVIRRSIGAPEQARGAVREAMLRSISFSAYPDAAPALDELRGRGVRLVAASNWDCSLPEVLERAGLARRLDAVVSSAGVGAAKPDARLFTAALDAVGAEPGRAIHVGDSVAHDVEGARSAGLRVVLLRRPAPHRGDGLEPERPPPGVPAISGLGELAPLTLAPG